MKTLSLKTTLASIFVFLPIFALCSCGSGSDPFTMDTNATLFVGDPSPVTPLQFLINPEQQSSDGQLTAEIDQEFTDHFELTITELEIDFDFADVGPIQIVLDPNKTSTATVFKLKLNGNPAGTHTMTLNLIIQTPEQNLVLDDVSFSSTTNLLSLDQALPSLGFFVQGVGKELDISTMQVSIPPSLNISDRDPN